MIAAFILAMGLQADFMPNATLPKKNVYTGCGGGNVSPMLRWSGVPARTRSFVLTVFDPDAPHAGGWWHWIAYDILPAARGLAAGSGAAGSPGAGKFGKNDFGDASYDGPCPPPGRPHRYIFTLYALNVAHVSIPNGHAVEPALRGHVLARAHIIGRYGR
ncbi:MAG TPA: YbhB/YbcL family Raf kinase inhibitor-like protein [Candidatus Acidoferrales bacterium]|nr:YbhB/YbcL family Raf kinase inhibitor-like protein [Candidatus Acidoferrales bacterium]